MKLLVSINNKNRAEGTELPGVFLLEVDTKTKEVTPVRLRHQSILKAIGISGLSRYRDGFVAVMQSYPTQLVHFNEYYNVLNVWYLYLVQDGHSVCAVDNKIYVASAGTDSVVEVEPGTGSKVFWNHNDHGRDTIHLNSIVWHNGELFATAFGEKKTELWRSATEGYLINLNTNQKIINPIYQPHSVTSTGDGLLYCESCRMVVGNEVGQKIFLDKGYLRGLAITKKHIYVGSSKGRNLSKSTGLTIDNIEDPGVRDGNCEILVLHRDPSNLAHCTKVGMVRLERYAHEVYDILPLESE